MDYDLANNYAKQIEQGGSAQQHQKLAGMCTSYLLYLRKKLGFHCIPDREITHELATDAVSDAIMAQARRNLPFTICLHNAFRDCCRQRVRIIREQYVGGIMEKCDVSNPPFMIGIGMQSDSAEDQAQNNELLKLAHKAIDNHDRFSKKVLYQKSKGSTYPEMADIFSTTLNECKRVYWHDINHIRKQIGQNYEN